MIGLRIAPAHLAEPNRLDLMAAGLNITLRHLRRSALLAGIAAAAVVPWARGEEAPAPASVPQRMPVPPRSAQPAAVRPSSGPIVTQRVAPVGFRTIGTESWVHEALVIREPRDGDDVPHARSAMASDSQSRRLTPQPATRIHWAALQERAGRPQPHWQIPDPQQPVLPGYSVDSLRQSATDLLDEASVKLAARAYLTAGAKAIEALQWLAQAADAQAENGGHRSGPTSRDLATALMAIREAEDFVGKYGTVDSEAIARMVRSHGTDFLKPYDTANLNGLAAADVYLDGSRQRLATLAAADPLGAEALRILAQSYRLRDGGAPFGLATSVHLMRAAAGGAPNDRQIAIDLVQTLKAAGLHDESQWATMQIARLSAAEPSMIVSDEVSAASATLEDSLRGDGFGGPERGEVQLMQVSPAQFAAISSLAAGPPGVPRTVNPAALAAQHAGARSPTAEQTPHDPATESSGGEHRFSRALEPIRRLWQ